MGKQKRRVMALNMMDLDSSLKSTFDSLQMRVNKKATGEDS
jgi:hypothetical protein